MNNIDTPAIPAPVTSRRYTESVSLFVDPETRAYTLGRAVELANQNGWATPRESEVLRAILDESIDRHREGGPATYNRIVEIGKAEMARRADAREK